MLRLLTYKLGCIPNGVPSISTRQSSQTKGKMKLYIVIKKCWLNLTCHFRTENYIFRSSEAIAILGV